MAGKKSHRMWTIAVAALLCGLAAPATAQRARRPRKSPVSEEVIKKITEAAPAKAAAKPAKPRKLLVFTRCTGYRHSSIPVGSKALEILGTKTGAFQVTVTDDPSYFDADKLKDFDAVFMNNCSGKPLAPGKGRTAEEKKLEKKRLKNLLEFVRGGKGLAGLHAATDCMYHLPEYGQMIGGVFAGHPWGRIYVRVDEPKHPVNAAFAPEGFKFSDEIYRFKAPYSREKQRVLLSIDVVKSKLTGHRGLWANWDHGLSWVKSCGKGRVFYMAFGHRHEIFWNKMILRHLLDGVQFTLGDLAGDTTAGPPCPEKPTKASAPATPKK